VREIFISTYHDWGSHLLDEISILLPVDVRCETVLLDTTPSRNHNLFSLARRSRWSRFRSGPTAATGHDRWYTLWFVHDLLSHCSFDAVPSNDDPISIIRRPTLQQFPTNSILQHARASQHHASPDIIEALQVLQAPYEFKVPGSALADITGQLGLRHALAEQALDVIVHGADVRLVDDHALPREVGGIVDRELLEVRMAVPVLVEDQKELLGSTEREDGHQHPTAAVQDAGDALHQGGFALDPRDVRGDAVGAFGDKDVDFHVRGHFGRYQVAVVFARIVAREEDLEAGDLDQEHGGSKDVACRIGGYADGGDGVGGVVVYCFDLGEGGEVVGFGVELYSLLGGGRCVSIVD